MVQSTKNTFYMFTQSLNRSTFIIQSAIQSINILIATISLITFQQLEVNSSIISKLDETLESAYFTILTLKSLLFWLFNNKIILENNF